MITHDSIGYQRFVKTIQETKAIQLGSPSIAWLYEALNHCDELIKEKNKLKTPCLLFQASDELIVDNRAQDRFAEDQPFISVVVTQGARHQILLEKDDVRDHVLSQALNFYNEVIA